MLGAWYRPGRKLIFPERFHTVLKLYQDQETGSGVKVFSSNPGSPQCGRGELTDESFSLTPLIHK